MDTKENAQDERIYNYIKILQSAFGCFFGKGNVRFSFVEENLISDDALKDEFIFELKDKASKSSKEIKCSFVQRSKLFESFLFESYNDVISINNILNLTDTEVDNFGRKIYQKACLLFEKYIRDFFHIHIENIIEISSSYYEGIEADGSICFLLNTENQLLIELADNQDSMKISFCRTNIKKIRKMLEISSNKVLGTSFGLGFSYDNEWKLDGFINYIPENNHWIRFHFVKHMVWDLYWNAEPVIRYNCGEYINPEKNYKSIFQRKTKDLVGEYDYDKIWDLVDAAIMQKHGTTLIVICEEESIVEKQVANLLKVSSGTMLKPTILKAEYVRRLTAIDGALVIDHKGKGYGYGIILTSQGNSKIKRDSGRGARYNSAKLYIADLYNSGKIAMAVIVSEDGIVNFYSTNDAEEEGTEDED